MKMNSRGKAYLLVSVTTLWGCDGLVGVDFHDKRLRAESLSEDASTGTDAGGDLADSAAASDVTNEQADSHEVEDRPTDGAGSEVDSPLCAPVPDLLTDPKNCGTCGHDCLGGACDNGRCQPIVLAKKLPQPAQMAIDGSGVFFSNVTDDSIRSAALTGGNVTVLAAPATTQWSGVWGVAVDKEYVYWAATGGSTAGGVFRVSKGTREVKALATDLTAPMVLRIDNDHAYWNDLGDKKIHSAPIEGGSAGAVVDEPNVPIDVALDDTHIYWIAGSGGDIKRSAKTEGATQAVAQGLPLLHRIVLDAGWVYYVTKDTGELGRVAKAGGEPETLVKNVPTYSASLAVDEQNVYWGTASGEVFLASKLDRQPTTLVGGQGAIADLAVDDKAVYWLVSGNGSEATGVISKIAK